MSKISDSGISKCSVQECDSSQPDLQSKIPTVKPRKINVDRSRFLSKEGILVLPILEPITSNDQNSTAQHQGSGSSNGDPLMETHEREGDGYDIFGDLVAKHLRSFKTEWTNIVVQHQIVSILVEAHKRENNE